MTQFVVGVKLDGNSAGLAKAAADAKRALADLNAGATTGAKSMATTHGQAVASMGGSNTGLVRMAGETKKTLEGMSMSAGVGMKLTAKAHTQAVASLSSGNVGLVKVADDARKALDGLGGSGVGMKLTAKAHAQAVTSMYSGNALLVKAAMETKSAYERQHAAVGASAKQTAQTHAQAVARMRGDFQGMTQAREALGVRSERRIQQEIVQTQLAYRRLSESGTLSWQEQRRAAAAMHSQVRDLTNEMGRLTKGQKIAAGFKGVGLAAAGVAAGAAVVAPKVQKAMAYDLRLAHMTNTAFNDRDNAGRTAGKAELDGMVKDAVRYGGGTRDDAASTLNTILSSGAFKPDEARQIFREAVMAGTANDADAQSFANLAVKANKSMGIAPERMGAMFGMGTYAGQQGQFEIRDMAKHLPRQMGSASQIGLYGEAGFAKLAAVNQAAVNTAGSTDEAGINVANLVAKLGSADTAKKFHKQFGVDLPKALAEGRAKGVDAFDVVGGMLTKELANNKNYQAVQKQISAAPPGTDRRASLEAIGNIAQGTVVGKVFEDQQALMALVAYMQDRERVNAISAGALNNTDAATKNMEQVRSTASFSAQQLTNERDIANQNAMTGLTPAIKGLTDKTVGLMQEYPGYTTAIVGTTTALTALAAAAGTAALANGLLAGGGLGGVKGKIGDLLGGGLGKVAGAAGAAGGFALPALAVGAAGAVGYGAGSLVSKGIEGTAAADKVGEVVARALSLFGNEEAAKAVAVNDAIKNSRVGGEIVIHVKGNENAAVQQEVRPFNGTQMRVKADVGRTNPEGSW